MIAECWVLGVERDRREFAIQCRAAVARTRYRDLPRELLQRLPSTEVLKLVSARPPTSCDMFGGQLMCTQIDEGLAQSQFFFDSFK